MRGATEDASAKGNKRIVSIHAPHAGRDRQGLKRRRKTYCFNPRAPCGARQDIPRYVWACLMFQSTRPMRGTTDVDTGRRYRPKFQSTRPMRGATDAVMLYRRHLRFQSTRPMRGATRHHHRGKGTVCFNPRAPCGARHPAEIETGHIRLFQSTRPMRGATSAVDYGRACRDVSIHAPHAGRD